MLVTALLLACAAPKEPLILKGTFVEACSCSSTCSFETRGALPGCNALGAYIIDSGSYGGQDVSGSRIGFVTSPKGALFVYAQAPPAEADGVKKLAFALFAEGFGTLEGGLNACPITLDKTEGELHLSFDGGRIADLRVKPVFGGNGSSPIELSNVFGDPYDRLFQASVVSGAFHHSGHDFRLEGTSAFYDPQLDIKKDF